MYNGTEPYIFISYSHKNSEVVVPIINELAKNNFRVWYDDGIEIATEWPEYLENKLYLCGAVLAFLSDDFVDSVYCRNEINFAIAEKKEVVPVYLDNLQTTRGLKLQLNSNHSIFRNDYANESAFFQSLTDSGILKKYCDVRSSGFPLGKSAPQLHEKVLGKTTFPGGKYLGELVNGIPNGKGKCTLSNGDVYKGDFVNGNFCGEGKHTFSNGDVFEGMFIAGEQDGDGKYTYKEDGRVLEGEFVNYKIVGKGKCTFPDDTVYEGYFVDNKLEGIGKLTFGDGAVYEGEFANDKVHGKGKMIFANGDVYEGDYVEGKFNGEGTIIYSNGNMYKGGFADFEYSGEGQKTYANGDVYKGDYANGKRNGNGVYFIASEGEFIKGFWKDNDIINGVVFNKKSKKIAKYIDGKRKKILF